MAIIYKPSTRKGPVFLHSGGRSGEPPTITLADGTVVTGSYYNTIDEGGGPNTQYVFPSSVLGQKGAKLSFGGQTQDLANTNMSYRGDTIGGLQESSKGAIGGYGGYGQPNFSPGVNPGGFNPYPAYMGGMFPNAAFATFNPIAGANYQFTDPMEFAKQYGEFNRGEYTKNMALSKGFALDQIDTELQGLQHYAPAAAALKREQTSLDNQFNQEQRLAQIQQAMPGAQRTLQDQASRAATYAAGGIPDALQDRALELGVRSRAADQAASGGFGAGSSVARKASDLMSAEQRLQIAQYGEQLTGTNLQQQQQLLLAPTEYSNAGQQINVMPSVSASQLQAQNMGQLSAQTMVSATNALQSTIQQNQYSAGLQQQTQQFNASGLYNASLANAQIQNSFSMGKFNYDVNYAGAVAGAAQNDVNMTMALMQQAQARQQAEQTASEAQTANTISAGTAALGTIGGLLKAAGVFGDGGNTSPGSQTSVPEISDILGPDSMIESGVPDFSVDLGNENGSMEVPSIIDNGVPEFDVGYNDPSASAMDSVLGSSDFSTYASQVPIETARSLIGSPSARGYAADAGISSAEALQLAFKPSTEFAADSVLANAGIAASATALPNAVPIGTNYQGQTMYANPKLQAINDPSPGVGTISNLGNFISSLGVKSVDQAQFQSLIGSINDPGVHQTLDTAATTGNIKQFINSTQAITKTQGMVAAGLSAYKIAQAWPKMSTGQKSLALASIGLQGIKSAYGSLDKTPVEASARDGYKPMSVSNALAIASTGLNAAEVAMNWGDLNNAQRILGGARTATSIAQLGVQTGLISKGGEVAQSVPYVNLAASAFNVYNNWPKMGTEQRAVATAALAQAGAMAAGYTIPGLNIALAAYQGAKFAQAGYNEYYKGGTANQKKGFMAGMGGAALLGGPGAAIGLAAGLGVISMVHGLTRSGKGKDQKMRDAFRSDWQDRGLADDDYNIALADGTMGNIGTEGPHAVRDGSKLVGGDTRAELKDYEIDYTNDMDFASGMAGTTLSRLMYGGRNNTVDNMGALSGNALLGSVGHGKDMTEQNFNTVMGNARGLYAKAGITSKEDALKLLARAGQEKRLTAADQAAALQTISFMYDKDGYQQASSLMKGRWVGVQNLKDAPARSPTISTGIQNLPQYLPGSRIASIATNGMGSSVGRSIAGMKITPYSLLRSREDIVKANLQKFGQAAYG